MECSLILVFIAESWDGLGGTLQITWFHPLPWAEWPEPFIGGHSSILTPGEGACQGSQLLLGELFPFPVFGKHKIGETLSTGNGESWEMQNTGSFLPEKKKKNEGWDPCHQTVSSPLSLPWGIPCVWHSGWSLSPPVRMDAGAYGTQNASLWSLKLPLPPALQSKQRKKIILFVLLIFCGLGKIYNRFH